MTDNANFVYFEKKQNKLHNLGKLLFMLVFTEEKIHKILTGCFSTKLWADPPKIKWTLWRGYSNIISIEFQVGNLK